jgi:hypothetical protein
VRPVRAHDGVLVDLSGVGVGRGEEIVAGEVAEVGLADAKIARAVPLSTRSASNRPFTTVFS